MKYERHEANFAYFHFYFFSPSSGTVASRRVEADVG